MILSVVSRTVAAKTSRESFFLLEPRIAVKTTAGHRGSCAWVIGPSWWSNHPGESEVMVIGRKKPSELCGPAAIEKVPIAHPHRFTPVSFKNLPSSLPAMLSRSKRQAPTTDDLMRRQELGPRKRQKCPTYEDEDSLRGSGSPVSGEDSQSEGLSASDEGKDSQGSASDIPMWDDEATIPSRFSFESLQGNGTKETTVPPLVSSPLPPTFAGLGASSSLVSAMNKMSIHTPTEIQAACIPPLLDGMCFSLRSAPSSMLKILAR